MLNLPKKFSLILLSRWLRLLSSRLHFSERCYRSCTPVIVHNASVPTLWNRESNKRHYLHHIQLANSICHNESPFRVYARPWSLACCWICKMGRSGPSSFILFFSSSERLVKGHFCKEIPNFLWFPQFYLKLPSPESTGQLAKEQEWQSRIRSYINGGREHER